MIVPLHAAAGAATGAATRSRLLSVALGPLVHLAFDRAPHRHARKTFIEYAGGALVLAVVARRRGLFDAATLGAFAAVVPDLEHRVPALRVGGAKVFHRRPGGDRRNASGLSVRAQATLATGLLVAAVLRDERRCA